MNPVHFSTLKRIGMSPAHYRYAVDHGVPETRPMRIGSAVHALVLGGPLHHYDGERRGKAWTEFRDAHDDGTTIVTTPELEEAQAIAAAVADHPLAQSLLVDAKHREETLEWSYLGRACAGRLDAFGPDSLIELKVTSCADPERFQRHAFKSAWEAQLAWYLHALGRPMSADAYFIAVESTAPHPVTVFHLTEAALVAGEKTCRAWMERLLACEAVDEWPGYIQGLATLDVPDWMGEPLTLQIDGESCEL